MTPNDTAYTPLTVPLTQGTQPVSAQGNVIPLQRADAKSGDIGEVKPRLTIARDDSDEPAAASPPQGLDLLTINLDDQLMGMTAGSASPRRDWKQIETRLAAITLQLLDRLDATNNKATFFTSGWIGDNAPDIVREVARRGHEIASAGYYRRSPAAMGPEELRSDAVRARIALETAIGAEVRGHRVARGWLTLRQLWVLSILAEEGFVYDSSFRPHGFSPWPKAYCRPHSHRFEGHVIHELPLSSTSILGFRLPISGGGYMRRLPQRIIGSSIENWHETAQCPWLLQFHVCDLETEPSQAEIAESSAPDQPARPKNPIAAPIDAYLERYHFCSIATYLGQSSALPHAGEPETTNIVGLAQPQSLISKVR